jgi:hypothetical protein
MLSWLVHGFYWTVILLITILFSSGNSFRTEGRLGGLPKVCRIAFLHKARFQRILHVKSNDLKLKLASNYKVPDTPGINDDWLLLKRCANVGDAKSFGRYLFYFAKQTKGKRKFLHANVLADLSSMILEFASSFTELELSNAFLALTHIGFAFTFRNDRALLTELKRLYLSHPQNPSLEGAILFLSSLRRSHYDWTVYQENEILQLIEKISYEKMTLLQSHAYVSSISMIGIPWKRLNEICQKNILEKMQDFLNITTTTSIGEEIKKVDYNSSIIFLNGLANMNGFNSKEISQEFSNTFLNLMEKTILSIDWTRNVEYLPKLVSLPPFLLFLSFVFLFLV